MPGRYDCDPFPSEAKKKKENGQNWGIEALNRVRIKEVGRAAKVVAISMLREKRNQMLRKAHRKK